MRINTRLVVVCLVAIIVSTDISILSNFIPWVIHKFKSYLKIDFSFFSHPPLASVPSAYLAFIGFVNFVLSFTCSGVDWHSRKFVSQCYAINYNIHLAMCQEKNALFLV